MKAFGWAALILTAGWLALAGCQAVPPVDTPLPSADLPATRPLETAPVETAVPETIIPTTVPAETAPVETVPASGQPVVIEDGRCCAGGKIGETIPVQVAYQPPAGFGDAAEIRVVQGLGASCADTATLEAAAWQPFQPQQTYEVTTLSGWVGYYVTAQFRSPSGDLSEVFCADISVEGMP